MTSPTNPGSPELTEVLERAREYVGRADDCGRLARDFLQALSSKNELPSADFTDGGLHIATIHWAMAVCTSRAVMCGYKDARCYPYIEAADAIREQLQAALNPKDTGQTVPYSDDHLGIDGGGNE
jgi:hypothetical protein